MEDANYADDYAAGVAETIRAEVEGADDPADAAAGYVEYALDADYLVDSRGRVKAVHLLVTTGGPHAEVRHRVGSDVVQVHAWWSGVHAERLVHAPALAADLDGLGDAWQDANLHGAGVTR